MMMSGRMFLISCQRDVAMNEYRSVADSYVLAFVRRGVRLRHVFSACFAVGHAEGTDRGRRRRSTATAKSRPRSMAMCPRRRSSFGDHRQVVVEHDRIFVDGEVYPGLPDGTQKVEIDVVGGKATLKADGQVLAK